MLLLLLRYTLLLLVKYGRNTSEYLAKSAAPANARSGLIANNNNKLFLPALIIDGEFDVLRDRREAYAHKLIDELS